MSEYPIGDDEPRVLAYRVRELSRLTNSLVKWRGEVDVERSELRLEAKSLAEEMRDLKAAVDTLRKTMLGFALTIAGSAVVFAFTVLTYTRKL